MPNPLGPAAGGAMPAPAQTSEYRALQLYAAPPAGCIVFPVTREGFEPHLRLGEIAIVDPADREPQSGELYVIQWNSGRREIVQIWTRNHRGIDGESFIGWWAGDLNRPRGLAEVNRWFREGRRISCSDGPYDPEHLREKLVGRVVGILAPAFDEPRRLGGSS